MVEPLGFADGRCEGKESRMGLQGLGPGSNGRLNHHLLRWQKYRHSWEPAQLEESGVQCWAYTFQLPIRHPARDVQEVTGYLTVKSRGEIWARDIHLGVTGI